VTFSFGCVCGGGGGRAVLAMFRFSSQSLQATVDLFLNRPRPPPT
jgi:hypothetical protein